MSKFLLRRVIHLRLIVIWSLLSFPSSHRHPDSHSCSNPVQTTLSVSKNEAARTILAKNFPAPASKRAISPRTTITVPTNPKKLAQYHQVNLMRMRHRATPANPKDKASLTPLEQRLHVQVMPADDVDKRGGKIFWFPKVLYLFSSFVDGC
jgi:hypothetical protein